MCASLHFHDIRNLVEQRQNPAQHRDIRDFQREGHAGDVLLLVGLGVDREHVDFFVGQQAGDVAQQPGAFVRDDVDVHRVGLATVCTPAHFDQALFALVVMTQGVGAILAVDGDPLSARDEANDGIARQRIAAPGHAREQIADTLDADARWGLAGLGARTAKTGLVSRSDGSTSSCTACRICAT